MASLENGTVHNLQADSQLTSHGFSAGSLNGLAIRCITKEFEPAFEGTTNLGALACSVDLIHAHVAGNNRTLRIIH